MRKTLALAGLVCVSSACAHTSTSGATVFDFAESAHGKQARTLRLALSEKPAETCLAGQWKAARVLDDPSGYTRRPAYKIEGNHLEVLLINELCDSYDSYAGTLTGSSFTGEHVLYGLGYNIVVGTVVGVAQGL